jgi:fatty-acid desaturase
MESAVKSPVASERKPWPESTQPVRLMWDYTTSVIVVHLLALLAFLPWCFSWSGVVLCLAGLYLFGTLGINLAYHRLLTHRSLQVPLWLERVLAIIGVCCLQDSPARWVAVHRMHHQHSDAQPDPHTPKAGFWWGHMGWLFYRNRQHDTISHFERYARDLLRDPFYFGLERSYGWLWVYVLHAFVIYAIGVAIGWLSTGEMMSGVQFGVSLMVWGVFVRTVMVWHITWSVNSVTHMWGYRNYGTTDDSRNNWLVGLVSNGEGWHNNHHWHQRCAQHGHRWWEIDITYWTIWLLERAGLATRVVKLEAYQSHAAPPAEPPEA